MHGSADDIEYGRDKVFFRDRKIGDIDGSHEIGIRTHYLVKAEAVVEIQQRRIPPVKKELIYISILVPEVLESALQVIKRHGIIILEVEDVRLEFGDVIKIYVQDIRKTDVISGKVSKLVLRDEDVGVVFSHKDII